MKHKGHHVTYRREQDCNAAKYSPRPVLTTNDPQAVAAFYQQTDAATPLGPRQTVAGCVQHPTTSWYQVWISTNGYDVICLSAHARQRDAERDIQEIKAVLGSEDYYQETKVAALLQRLKNGSGAEPQPLPDSLVRQITRAILHAVVDSPGSCRSAGNAPPPDRMARKAPKAGAARRAYCRREKPGDER